MFARSMINPYELNPLAVWKHAIKKNRKLVFNKLYMPHMADEAMMAVIFDYKDALLEKVLQVSLSNEIADVIDIFDNKISVCIENKNIVIREM